MLYKRAGESQQCLAQSDTDFSCEVVAAADKGWVRCLFEGEDDGARLGVVGMLVCFAFKDDLVSFSATVLSAPMQRRCRVKPTLTRVEYTAPALSALPSLVPLCTFCIYLFP